MATIDDRISFRYYREHCHDIRYNAKKFGCEHNGIIYGADMCAIGFGIMTNIDGDTNYLIQEECKGKIEHSKNYQSRNKKARQLSDEQLFEQYKKRKTDSKKRKKGTRIEPYERNEMVAEIAKRRAKGICDLADEDGNYHQAPFEVDGMPFLESHHVMWLSKGGDDDIDNVVALCRIAIGRCMCFRRRKTRTG